MRSWKTLLKKVVKLVGLLFFLAASSALGGELDLTKAVVITPPKLTKQETKAVEMLVDEVHKRAQIRWNVVHQRPAGSGPMIAVGQENAVTRDMGLEIEAGRLLRPEGYKILVLGNSPTKHLVAILGNDSRGVLFGIGRLLRELHMARGKVAVSDTLKIDTAPKYPFRGQQLGYRQKTNSYDGWDLRLWEQYYRDLAVFGTNAVELIPPRSDDAPDSPHFPLPPMEMMVGMSKLADDYGFDVWIWYPAMDADYSKPQTVAFALREWGEVFKRLPRIDAVFVPGGDPGHTRPRILMALLEKQGENLRRYHPKAQMWVSPQSFTREWMDEFLEIVQKEELPWLNGVVYGPQVRMSLPELRAALPKKYPVRRYPDITHSMRCQYPVPDWDRAFAFTQAREVINPRPVDEANIFRAFKDSAIGFITYSEGCNDDVNKMIWSSLGWNPNAKVEDILREYSRYFIGDRYADDFTRGLLALEKNWRGPLIDNESVYTTLKHFQALEKLAQPRDRLNWRFQQALYRAYYDAYLRSRLIYETALEEKAMEKLRDAKKIGSLAAMKEAEEILARAQASSLFGEQAGSLSHPTMEWRARCFELAEALFQSIRMQLSVERYKAEAGRGNTLDTIDVPLNDRLWLEKQFAELRQLQDESERLQGIQTILTWTDPGPGGFYDDLGNPSRQPHLVRGLSYQKDPAHLHSSLVGFNYVRGWRLSWCTHAESLYDASLQMHYKDLDPNAQYKIRVVYAGDNAAARVRLLANDKMEIHSFIKKERGKRMEFEIPQSAMDSGELRLSWYQEPGKGGGGRGCQVAEVWLMKK